MIHYPLNCSRFALSLWIAVAALLLPLSQKVSADQLIYTDTLQSGWQNWSWCTVDANASGTVHSGAASAKVTYTAGYQAFYLHHDNMDSTPYTAIRFWINGGTTNGRTINVSGLLNGNAPITVPLTNYVSIAAGVWKQVTIPLADLKVDRNTTFSGFWLQEAAGTAQSDFYVDDVSLISAPPPALINLKVNTTQILRNVDERIFGVNAAVWDNQFNSTATVTQLKTMGNRILRFPGGSLSDGYHWKTNTTDSNTWQWATSFDAFAGIAKQAGSQAFITVNYGTGTPQEAADWVAYSNLTKKYGFKYWEIGNECYGSWEEDSHSQAHDPYTYALMAKQYIQMMKAKDSSIKVGIVVIPGEDAYANNTSHPATNPRTHAVHNGWTPVLLATLKSLGVTPDFVIHHRYEQAPGQETDAGLLQSSAGWKSDAANLRQQLTDYLGTAGNSVELDCTENNSVYTKPGKQTTSLVNGLFFADSMGQLLQTEFRSMVWWNLRNGGTETANNNSASLYGWRQYGDYGILEGSTGPFPVYYVNKLMSRFTGGGDAVLVASSEYSLLSVYAVKRLDGSVSLLIINKSPDYIQRGSIALTGFTPKPTATVASYGIPQDNAARTGSGSPDIAQSSLTNAAATFTYSFAPYSVTVISLTRQ